MSLIHSIRSRPKIWMRHWYIYTPSLVAGNPKSGRGDHHPIHARGGRWRNRMVFFVWKNTRLVWNEIPRHVYCTFFDVVAKKSKLALAPHEFKICMLILDALTWRIVTTGIQVWGAWGSWPFDFWDGCNGWIECVFCVQVIWHFDIRFRKGLGRWENWSILTSLELQFFSWCISQRRFEGDCPFHLGKSTWHRRSQGWFGPCEWVIVFFLDVFWMFHLGSRTTGFHRISACFGMVFHWAGTWWMHWKSLWPRIKLRQLAWSGVLMQMFNNRYV